jgi:hypothetical protein
MVFAGGFVVGLLLGHAWAGGFAALGVAIILNSAKLLPEWQTARETSEQPIGSVTPGEGAVEVVGTTTPDPGTTTAPLTDAECLGYVLAVEEYQYRPGGRHSSGRHRWVSVGGDAETHPFFVEDDSGLAWVDDSGLQFFLDAEREIELDERAQPPDAVRDFLADTDHEMVCDDKRRYTEYRLDGGDEVHVAAEVTTPPDRSWNTRPSVALTDGEAAPMFSVSTDPQMDVAGELLWQTTGGVMIGGTLLAMAVASVQWGLLGAFVTVFLCTFLMGIVAFAADRGELFPD